MSTSQVRRVALDFVVEGSSHESIVKQATERWRSYMSDPEAELPFDTECYVTESEAVVADDMKLHVTWSATVVIRQRGSNY